MPTLVLSSSGKYAMGSNEILRSAPSDTADLSVADPLANEIHDLEHLEAKCPEVISGIREWFRWYKTPDGKPLNSFGFEGRALPRAKANEVISVAFDHWRELRFGKSKHSGLWTKKVSTWTDGL